MTLLNRCVAIVDRTSKRLGLQSDIQFRQWISSDGAGAGTFTAWTSRQAVVTFAQKLVKSFDGEMVTSTATVVFLDPTVVGQLDEIILPDGSTGVIVGLDGPMDASNATLITQIYLG